MSVFAAPRQVSDPGTCFFYHCQEIPGVGFFPGPFDLRGALDTYLGGVDSAGKRVLEIGPASGFVTFELERQGGEVVAVDVSREFFWDLVPYSGLAGWGEARWAHMEALRNAFWFVHGHLGSRARVHYGSAYDLPPELGEFDVSILAMMLLHNRDPLAILRECAGLTRETLVVVEQYDEALASTGLPSMSLVPGVDNGQIDTWWHLSPALVRRFLEVLGFVDFELSLHRQRWRPPGSQEPQTMPCYTLVAHRLSER